MKNSDVRQAFPSLLEEWINETKQDRSQLGDARFSSFYSWLTNSYPQYAKFRSTMGADEDLEVWFDEATWQLWKR